MLSVVLPLSSSVRVVVVGSLTGSVVDLVAVVVSVGRTVV